MEKHYAAYGLALRSSFPLPGMTPVVARGLPSLELELVTPEQLALAWSGPDGPPVWRGRLGDGSDLEIESGSAGDLLFTNGERARYRLDAGKHVLMCAPFHPGLDWQRTLVTKVLSSISVMRGYEALHASAVESSSGALAIAAPTGMGKTTLALELMQRGWPLISDDVLALASTQQGVLAYPGTPHMNLAESSLEGLEPQEIGATLALIAGERWLSAHDIAREPRPMRAICLLERGPGLALDVHVLPPSPLPLAPYVLGLTGDVERERRKFDLYADLMGSTTLMRLTCDASVRPADLADLIEGALADRPAALAMGGVR
ncbi:MAG TPA: hypothetical protein VN892_09880 [Solirubrobacteraceae bacterium]|nr:hypothetical protein [Solirubrobacteraceae bacterium]